jgi:hypothetical protein
MIGAINSGNRLGAKTSEEPLVLVAPASAPPISVAADPNARADLKVEAGFFTEFARA